MICPKDYEVTVFMTRGDAIQLIENQEILILHGDIFDK